MNLSAFLASAGINIALCVVLLILYSILSKQPGNIRVYFGQKLAKLRSKQKDSFSFERLVPSASWIVKAWQASEEDICASGGLDAVVFLRAVVFSIRIFSIAAVVCLFLVLPLNYFGKEMKHKEIPAESLDVFTIGNVAEGSKWLWAHCLALYVITCSACALLYSEYKSIAKLRLAHIAESPKSLSRFTVLVRGIPTSSEEESYGDTLTKFFANYYSSSYISHQMVHRSSRVQKLVNGAEKMTKMIKSAPNKYCGPTFSSCGLYKLPNSQPSDTDSTKSTSQLTKKECGAALVYFRTRHAALAASEALQLPNPMLMVTALAPEPDDIHWKNLYIPYRLLWVRKLFTLLATIVFMLFFLLPVTFVQGLTRLDRLESTFPFLKGILKRKFVNDLVTGYLPSVILILFLYAVPPLMMLFSTIEGPVSRSNRKRSACLKVLYFFIWNVFFANIISGSVLDRLGKFSIPKDLPTQLAKLVPGQAKFFMTYVLTSGWASLSCELLQPFSLISNLLDRFIFRNKCVLSYATMTFPYHTEFPRLLLFGLLGFNFSILAPLILPFLLVYFMLAFFVYRNQVLNVYVEVYQTGGLYWPIVHGTVIFSLVLTQVISLGVFGLKRSTIASGFMIPLIICTLLFNMYCRQRFSPIFYNDPAQVLIDMDWEDEKSGKLEEIHQILPSAYCQFRKDSAKSNANPLQDADCNKVQDPEDPKPDSAKLLSQTRKIDGENGLKENNPKPCSPQIDEENGSIEDDLKVGSFQVLSPLRKLNGASSLGLEIEEMHLK